MFENPSEGGGWNGGRGVARAGTRPKHGDCGASPTFRVTVDVRGAFISEGPPRLFLLLGWLLFYETLAVRIYT